MLAPPKGLTEDSLISQLAHGWGIEVAGLEYRPVGFGSHHWEAVEAGGARWFVTVDDLRVRRRDEREGENAALRRLSGSLGAARALRNAGLEFVDAPIPSLDGAILLTVEPGFAASVYPMLKGESFAWGRYTDLEHLNAVLRMLIDVHTAPADCAKGAPVDDFAVQMRSVLEQALAEGPEPRPEVAGRGPYAVPMARLLHEHAESVRRALTRYDELAAAVTGGAPESHGTAAASGGGRGGLHGVLTHGEPHPANTMRTIDGWMLIDWDTAALAPPERDLWDLDPGDGSAWRAYADATGYMPRPELIELYRLRWDLTDLALFTADFRSPHIQDANTAKSWAAVGGVGLVAGSAGHLLA